MKNLDPRSGLRQITTGKLYLPRRLFLELITSKDLKQIDISYFLIALIFADWDPLIHRYGYIRHTTKRISELTKIPYSTLQTRFSSLLDKGLLAEEFNCLKVKNFEFFDKAHAYASEPMSDEELASFFDISLSNTEKQIQKNEKSVLSQTINPKVVKEVPKEEGKGVHSNKAVTMNKPIVKSDEEYQRLYKENRDNYPPPGDMKWIDEHLGADGKTRL